METSLRLPYCYTALPSSTHIRVLEIEHDIDENKPLKGRLRTVDLHDDTRIPYAALSYTWGRPEFSEKLLLDDTIKLITSNLASALHRFRSVGHIRWIWADAICINQEDDKEKSLQIPLMGKIYHDASYVMVWLGNQSRSIESMKTVRTAAARILENPDDPQTFSQAILPHITYVTQLPWFSRRWVIQEVTLNPSVSFHCGSVELSWQRLYKVVHMAKLMLQPTPSLDSAISLWRLWLEWSISRIETAPNVVQSFTEIEGAPTSMTALLRAFDNFDCSDPRDLIYSILGLQRDRLIIDVNYTYSTEEVFINFAEAYSNHNNETRDLLFCVLAERTTRHNGNNDSGLPSWIPDWRISPVGGFPLELRPVAGQFIRKSPNNSHHILTMNHFQNPSASEKDEAPLTIAYIVAHDENENFLDFAERVVRVITDWCNAERSIYGFNLNWIERSVLDVVYAFIPKGAFRNAPIWLTHRIPSRGWRMADLRGILEHLLCEDRAISLNMERLEATCRCMFVGLLNCDNSPTISSTSIGMGFSSIHVGDRIFISSARLMAPGGETRRDRLRAGLVLRKMPRLRQDPPLGDSIEAHTICSPCFYEFVGCCCVGLSYVMGNWMCYLSDIEIH